MLKLLIFHENIKFQGKLYGGYYNVSVYIS